jgi:hypothetical protein
MGKEQKIKLLKESYGIAFRVLASVMSLVEGNFAEFAGSVLERLIREHPDRSVEALSERAFKSIFAAMHLATFGVVRRVTFAVGSPHVLPVHRIVEEAGKSAATTLVRASLSMDQEPTFPTGLVLEIGKELSGNPLALSVLKGLVVNHFHMFDVRMHVRQQVCAALNIPIERAIRASVGVKMLPPRGSR